MDLQSLPAKRMIVFPQIILILQKAGKDVTMVIYRSSLSLTMDSLFLSVSTAEEFFARYKGLTEAMLENKDICGFCYTQLYDIEQEINEQKAAIED